MTSKCGNHSKDIFIIIQFILSLTWNDKTRIPHISMTEALRQVHKEDNVKKITLHYISLPQGLLPSILSFLKDNKEHTVKLVLRGHLYDRTGDLLKEVQFI